MPDWTIREATHRDIDAVLLLWQAAGAPATSGTHAEGLRTLLAADPRALLIAESGGAVVGSLIAAWDGWRAASRPALVFLPGAGAGGGLAPALTRRRGGGSGGCPAAPPAARGAGCPRGASRGLDAAGAPAVIPGGALLPARGAVSASAPEVLRYLSLTSASVKPS